MVERDNEQYRPRALLVAFTIFSGQIYVCNSATKEFMDLPPGRCIDTGHTLTAFGFNPWRNRYLVARY